jgi:hypothetical protein
MGLEIGGILGLIIIALDVWAIVNIIGSGSSIAGKILWIIAILLLPLAGLVAWFLVGPRKKRAAA